MKSPHSYNVWHPSAGHLMADYFSDSIKWEKLAQGDILVKDSHIALVSGLPLENNEVAVIESAIKWDNQSYKSAVISNEYVKDSNTIFRKHESVSRGYNPRRFSPPILKKLQIYKSNIINNIPYHECIYTAEWNDKNELSRPRCIMTQGKYYFVLEFSKAMAVKRSDINRGEYTTPNVFISSQTLENQSKSLKVTNVDNGYYNIQFFNSGKELYDGWGNQIDIPVIFNKKNIVIDGNKIGKNRHFS